MQVSAQIEYQRGPLHSWHSSSSLHLYLTHPSLAIFAASVSATSVSHHSLQNNFCLLRRSDKVTDSSLALDGLGYLKILAPPEKVLRWIEGKLNLLGRLPHYVSMDQKIYGRYGVLPTANAPNVDGTGEGSYIGSTERLGP